MTNKQFSSELKKYFAVILAIMAFIGSILGAIQGFKHYSNDPYNVELQNEFMQDMYEVGEKGDSLIDSIEDLQDDIKNDE